MLPNIVEPDSKSTDDVTIDVWISFAVIIPTTFKSVLTSKPLSGEIDALTLPLVILLRLSPVTPLAGILYKLPPSPINEPVKEPVVYEEVNELKLEVSVYLGASEAVNALVVVPLTVANNVPKTVKSPSM